MSRDAKGEGPNLEMSGLRGVTLLVIGRTGS